jgi:tetratricopeptide (TPR) repeat protein
MNAPLKADTPPVSRWKIWPWAAILVVCVLAAYASSFGGAFVFDDAPTIVRNTTIRDLSDLRQVLSPPLNSGTVSRPVANLAFAIDYSLWGYSARGYHVTNFLIHLGASLLLFGVIRRTWERWEQRGGTGARPGPTSGDEPDAVASASTLAHEKPASLRQATLWAAAIAAVWAMHPLHTAAVTFLTSRSESLAGFFYVLTLYAFIRHAEGGHRLWGYGAVVACILGVLTKEMVVSVPLFVLLYDRTLYAGTFRAALRARWASYAGFLVAWAVLAVVVVRSGGSRGGTCGFGTEVTPWIYLLTQCRAIVMYLHLALWPDALCFDYGRAVVRDVWSVVPQGMLLLGLAGATVVAVWKRWWLGLAGAWFFMILAPSSSFVPLATQTVAEHRMYLPLLAVVVVVAAAAGRVLGKRGWIVLALAAPVLGVLTHQRNALYAEPVALWRDTVVKQPNNSRARYHLGRFLVNDNRYDDALEQYDAGLAMENGKDGVLCSGRAGVLMLLGREDEGELAARRACELEPRNSEARTILGNVLWMRGRLADAEREFQKVLAKEPHNAEAEFGLGNVAYSEGKIEEAAVHFARSFAEFPITAMVANNLAGALLDLGRTDEALKYFGEAVRLDPKLGRARANYATLLAKAGRVGEAIPEFEAAVRLLPKEVEARGNLGMAYQLAGSISAARVQYEEVLRLEPGNVAARARLAALPNEGGQVRGTRP